MVVMAFASTPGDQGVENGLSTTHNPSIVPQTALRPQKDDLTGIARRFRTEKEHAALACTAGQRMLPKLLSMRCETWRELRFFLR
jgi:hypothetical protein